MAVQEHKQSPQKNRSAEHARQPGVRQSASPQAAPNLQHVLEEPAQASPAEILQLQQAAGNRAVSGLIQARLRVGPVGDAYEQQADRMADQVMRSPAPEIQRQGAPEEEELQAKRRGGDGFVVDEQTRQEIASQQSHGAPLPDDLQAKMEAHFGADFSAVRVHANTQAASLNRRLRASAFTHQADIYFASGLYQPGSRGSRRLLAHELTHVIQQGAAGQKGNSPSLARTAAGLPTAHQAIQRANGHGSNVDDENQLPLPAGAPPLISQAQGLNLAVPSAVNAVPLGAPPLVSQALGLNLAAPPVNVAPPVASPVANSRIATHNYASEALLHPGANVLPPAVNAAPAAGRNPISRDENIALSLFKSGLISREQAQAQLSYPISSYATMKESKPSRSGTNAKFIKPMLHGGFNAATNINKAALPEGASASEDWSKFGLATSLLGAGTNFRDAWVNFRNIKESWGEKNWKKKLESGAGGVAGLASGTGNLAKGTEKIGLAGEWLSPVANWASPVTSWLGTKLLGPVGTGISMLRNAYGTYKSVSKGNALMDVSRRIRQGKERPGGDNQKMQSLSKVARYAFHKKANSALVKGLATVGGGFSLAGGILGITAASLAAGPALAAAGALVGAGVGGYKLIHGARKRSARRDTLKRLEGKYFREEELQGRRGAGTWAALKRGAKWLTGQDIKERRAALEERIRIVGDDSAAADLKSLKTGKEQRAEEIAGLMEDQDETVRGLAGQIGGTLGATADSANDPAKRKKLLTEGLAGN